MSSRRPRILLLSAYDAGSHRQWREQLVASQPDFDWQVLALPPRFFRWRIRGNPLSWLHEPLLQQAWDLLLVTSMVDLATLRGLHPHLAMVPAIVYLHENQFAYPASAGQHHSIDPQMVNLYSAMAADALWFNSAWNRHSFLHGVQAMLAGLPDGVPEGLPEQLREKSRVLPVPIADALFVDRQPAVNPACPHLLWNHRWEYDKGPERLLLLLDRLLENGQDFRLSLVGEQFRQQPPVFATIGQRHRSRLCHYGYVERVTDYHRLLREADVVISTALHDFQGLAMLEAMAAGCLALAPNRLAYPEYVPAGNLFNSLPEDAGTEAQSAAAVLQRLLDGQPAPAVPDAFRLSRLQAQYRQGIESLLR